MKNVKETKKLNNKGFSLVELIIVVAIMAVLIGVLAPQYLKYVEKSRESADLDNYEAIVSAIEIYAADPTNSIPVGTLTFTKASPASADAAGNLDTVLKDAGITIGNLKTKSNKYGNGTITVSTNSTTGVVELTFSNADVKVALGR